MKQDKTYQPQQENFVFFEFDDDFLRQYDLPGQPCPIRMSILEEILENDSLTLTKVADECILYVQLTPQCDDKINQLLERLCHVAGIIVGRSGDDINAKKYLQIAHKSNPDNYPIAADYALSLTNTGDQDSAVGIYEKFITESLNDWDNFIPHVWTEAIKIHYWQKNYSRALELIEILLSKDLQDCSSFSKENLIAIAQDIKEKQKKPDGQ